jgi:ADP-ribose pyrophosphatase
VLTDYSHLNLVRVKYKDRNSLDKSWIYATRGNTSRPDAVVVVPFHTAQNKLVLIREFRVPLGEYQYGFPAGLVDPGESVALAGERELREETGLTMVSVKKESPPIFSSSGMTDESISLLYVECEGQPTTEWNEASEDIEVVMVSQDDAKALVHERHLIFDVKSWIVLEQFAAQGKVF